MTERPDLLELLAQSNPAPDGAELPTGMYDAGTSIESILERYDNQPSSEGWSSGTTIPRGLLIAAAVFLAALATGIILILALGRPDDVVDDPTTTSTAPTTTTQAVTTTSAPPETTSTPTTAVTTTIPEVVPLSAEQQQVIEDYQAAYNSNDADVFRAMFDPEAIVSWTTSDLRTQALDDWLIEYNYAIGAQNQIEVSNCAVDEAEIQCDVDLVGPVDIALYGEPFNTIQRFVIVDGKITSLWYRLEVGCCNQALSVTLFYNWMLDNHPEVLPQILDFGPTGPAPQLVALDETTGALFREYTALYREAVGP